MIPFEIAPIYDHLDPLTIHANLSIQLMSNLEYD